MKLKYLIAIKFYKENYNNLYIIEWDDWMKQIGEGGMLNNYGNNQKTSQSTRLKNTETVVAVLQL